MDYNDQVKKEHMRNAITAEKDYFETTFTCKIKKISDNELSLATKKAVKLDGSELLSRGMFKSRAIYHKIKTVLVTPMNNGEVSKHFSYLSERKFEDFSWL